ncbi:Arv1-domain-containing protein [Abortiporus biennis]|nr:Arv1-domain-containing protein [Abortiporus biennis]
MPICTSCTHPTPFLYTVYNTENNLRLEQCSNCGSFADPYVEHDTLTLILDLILLKRDVYRHLLFNRGSGVRRLGEDLNKEENKKPTISDGAREREKARQWHLLKLAAVLITVDAFIRWTHLGVSQPFDATRIDLATWNAQATQGFLRVFIGCLVETLAFHIGIVIACYILLHALDYVNSRKSNPPPISGIRQQFRYSLVPLSLLYSSLTKLFLLFLLSIWRPETSKAEIRPLPPQFNASHMFTNPVLLSAIEILDEDRLDREWVVRNVLGGMAAGFGLRVVLDCAPVYTTMVILVGWGVKTIVANLVSQWVGVHTGLADEQTTGEMWLAYSIP